MAGTCQQRSQSASSSTPLLVVANRRVSDARRAGLPSDGTRIVAYNSALPTSTPHTRLRYSGSSLTSSTPVPFPGMLTCGQAPPGEPGTCGKADPRARSDSERPLRSRFPAPDLSAASTAPINSRRHGQHRKHFSRQYGVAQRYHDLSEEPVPGVGAGRPGDRAVPRLLSRALGTGGAAGVGLEAGVD